KNNIISGSEVSRLSVAIHTIGIPTFSPLFRAGFFHPCRCVPGSKLLGEIGFQRSHLRIALFSSAYFEKVSSWQQAYRPLPGR
ncbi:hypothetical protein ACRE8N_24595, partial [Klebsiella pneumoniae]